MGKTVEVTDHALNVFLSSVKVSLESGPDRRQELIKAQCAVNFLDTIGLADLGQRFRALGLALDDLDNEAASILKHKRGRAGAPETNATWAARTSVALAIECFRRADKGDNKIIKELKKRSELTQLLKFKTAIDSSPFPWLERLKDGVVKNELALARWRHFKNNWQTTSDSPSVGG